jgi:hypothetical protein
MLHMIIKLLCGHFTLLNVCLYNLYFTTVVMDTIKYISVEHWFLIIAEKRQFNRKLPIVIGSRFLLKEESLNLSEIILVYHTIWVESKIEV